LLCKAKKKNELRNIIPTFLSFPMWERTY